MVKVERPDGGDGMRGWPPLHAGSDGPEDVFSGNFTSLNRNKRSVALDIKDKADLARLYALVEGADIFIENFRPGALIRSGLGYDQLRAHNPAIDLLLDHRLRPDRPVRAERRVRRHRPGDERVMSVTGEPDGPGEMRCAGRRFRDRPLRGIRHSRGRHARARDRQGCSCRLLHPRCPARHFRAADERVFRHRQGAAAAGSAHPRNAPYAGFDASDKPFTIAAGNDKLWRDTCAIVGRPDLPDDPRFATQSLRARNQDELAVILQPIFATRTAAEWLAELDAKGVPCAPINDFADILADPHVREMGWIQPMSMPNGAVAETVGFPIGITDYAFEITRQPPQLGEHNEEVFREWTQRPT